jgi:hypothetical protein
MGDEGFWPFFCLAIIVFKNFLKINNYFLFTEYEKQPFNPSNPSPFIIIILINK